MCILPYQRVAQQCIGIAEHSKKTEFGDLDIYFGCREMQRDNLYAEERALAKAEGIISSNNTAFSREANIPKVNFHSETLFFGYMSTSDKPT